jgi:hypothetical protein
LSAVDEKSVGNRIFLNTAICSFLLELSLTDIQHLHVPHHETHLHGNLVSDRV